MARPRGTASSGQRRGVVTQYAAEARLRSGNRACHLHKCRRDDRI
jgi:hypothetical protein